MLDLRDMEILTALDRQRHFARAAEECGISQPAFSARIRNLEHQVGVSIVNRGNRFQGFTPEGEIVLKWARRLMQDADGMRQEMTAAMDRLGGRLVLGVVPTALAFAARVPAVIRRTHPGLVIELHSATSDDIRRGLQNFRFGAGISYGEKHATAQIRETFLYHEEYLLIAPRALVGDARSIGWAKAAALPLCLLTRDMQNRRILESVFAQVGVVPNLAMETNALTAAVMQLQTGTAATILPRQLVDAMTMGPDLAVLELETPVLRCPMALLLPEREPAPPSHRVLAEALAGLAR